MHALDILRRSLQTNQDDSLTCAADSLCLGFVRVEDNLTCGSTGRSGKSCTNHLSCLQSLRIERGMQELIQGLGINALYCGLLVNLSLVNQITGDLDGCGSCSLAVTGLKEVELALLDGELHILHIMEVVLQLSCQLHELLIDCGHGVLKCGNGLGCTNTCNDVLTLGIEQVLADNALGAGRGIAGEGNAGTGGLTLVTEYHGLHIHGSTPGTGDIVHAAVYDGTGVIPGTEYG